jgi:ATP-dependent Lhr-like helicase
VKLAACDPLNLAGVFLPGPRVPAVPTNFLVFKDGIVSRTVLGREIVEQSESKIVWAGRPH